MRRPDDVRQAALKLMEAHNLHRLVGEVDVNNTLAIRLIKRAGANEIGVIRQRVDDSGKTRDVLLMDALQGDINGKL